MFFDLELRRWGCGLVGRLVGARKVLLLLVIVLREVWWRVLHALWDDESVGLLLLGRIRGLVLTWLSGREGCSCAEGVEIVLQWCCMVYRVVGPNYTSGDGHDSILAMVLSELVSDIAF